MAEIRTGRYAAEIDGDFVVFLIGARLNSPRHLLASLRDLGGRRRGMQAMLAELVRQPEKGLLAYRMGFPVIVQYWRSFEQLEAFARDPGDLHRPTWLDWFRRDPQGRTGIWHETYLVRAGEYEAIYDSVPEAGLATAGRAVPLEGTSSARIRLRREAAAEQERSPAP
jgi:fumigallin biosynthesis monooxygenase-like protein